MLKELFEQKQQHLNHFFAYLDLQAADKVLQVLYDCKGIFIFSGVGKSAFVAEKVAATMTSVGCKALFLSPTNALHGDIGIMTENDIFITFSKSGESDELLHLIPFVRNRKAQSIAIVSNAESRLAKAADFAITLPLERELCPFDMVPTTSAAIQMIFGDVLAIALMRRHNFSLDQYALNHPAGRIGKRITMKVSDLMLKGDSIPTCRSDQILQEILVELSNKRCGCVLVVDEHKNLKGIFTDGDLRRALEREGADALHTSVGDLMTCNPKRISPHTLALEAMRVMEGDQKHPVTVLPVLEENKVVGLIKMHDIVQSGI